MFGMKKRLDGFPVGQMTVVGLIHFSEPLALTSLFPYLYFMIRDFQIAPTENDIAKYSGYMAASFGLFQFISALQWGKLSDRIGRKKVLLTTVTLSFVCMLIFGFATNFYVALFARSLSGVCNGSMAVKRTVIGEIATEKRHQAFAFSMLPLLFNLGSIIGPAIGGSGYLTRPRAHSPYESNSSVVANGVYDNFLNSHPYTLPSVVVACFLAFSAVCGFLFLQETHESYKDKRDIGLEIGDKLLEFLGFSREHERPWKTTRDTEQSPLLEGVASSESAMRNIIEIENVQTSSIFTPRVVLALLANFLVTFHCSSWREFLPVFLAARFQRQDLQFPFKIKGGLEYDISRIGTLLSTTGIAGIFIVVFIFPWLDSKLGTLKGYRFSVSLFPAVYFSVPLLVFTVPEYNATFPAWFTPVFLYVISYFHSLAAATGTSQVLILNHRSAAKEHRVYVNSYAVTLASLAKFTSPLLFGYLTSLGDALGRSWLAWWVMSFVSLNGLVISFLMQGYEDEDDLEKVLESPTGAEFQDEPTQGSSIQTSKQRP